MHRSYIATLDTEELESVLEVLHVFDSWVGKSPAVVAKSEMAQDNQWLFKIFSARMRDVSSRVRKLLARRFADAISMVQSELDAIEDDLENEEEEGEDDGGQFMEDDEHAKDEEDW